MLDPRPRATHPPVSPPPLSRVSVSPPPSLHTFSLQSPYVPERGSRLARVQATHFKTIRHHGRPCPTDRLSDRPPIHRSRLPTQSPIIPAALPSTRVVGSSHRARASRRASVASPARAFDVRARVATSSPSRVHERALARSRPRDARARRRRLTH